MFERDCHDAVEHLQHRVEIVRDEWGIPHIKAQRDVDLFFGFGYATAQDRLFQLDYLRLKARGQLSEVLGREALDSDRLYRTLDLHGIAKREAEGLPAHADAVRIRSAR